MKSKMFIHILLLSSSISLCAISGGNCQESSEKKSPNESNVVYALKNIRAGTKFSSRMLGLKHVKTIIQGAIVDRNQVIGTTALEELKTNQVICTHHVSGLSKGTKADPELIRPYTKQTDGSTIDKTGSPK